MKNAKRSKEKEKRALVSCPDRLPSLLAASIPNSALFHDSLRLELGNLSVEIVDNLQRLFNRRDEFSALPLPASELDDLLVLAAALGVDLLARLAALAVLMDVEDEFHAARFTCAVLAVAVLAEAVPFPVAAVEQDLVEEAHGGGG